MKMPSETGERIYELSDNVIMKKAEAIIDTLRKTVSNAQIENLENICLSLRNVESIIAFASHQIEKNKNRDFYSAVKRYIQKDIKEVSKEFPAAESKEVQYLLAKEFIQHLISANMYKAYKDKKNKRRQHNDRRNR